MTETTDVQTSRDRPRLEIPLSKDHALQLRNLASKRGTSPSVLCKTIIDEWLATQPEL